MPSEKPSLAQVLNTGTPYDRWRRKVEETFPDSISVTQRCSWLELLAEELRITESAKRVLK